MTQPFPTASLFHYVVHENDVEFSGHDGDTEYSPADESLLNKSNDPPKQIESGSAVFCTFFAYSEGFISTLWWDIVRLI